MEVEGPGGEVSASLPLVVGAALSVAEAGKAKPAAGKAAKVPQAAKGKDGRALIERAQVRHYKAWLLFTCLSFRLSMPFVKVDNQDVCALSHMTVRDDQALKAGRVLEKRWPKGHWCGAVKKFACTGTTRAAHHTQGRAERCE